MPHIPKYARQMGKQVLFCLLLFFSTSKDEINRFVNGFIKTFLGALLIILNVFKSSRQGCSSCEIFIQGFSSCALFIHCCSFRRRYSCYFLITDMGRGTQMIQDWSLWDSHKGDVCVGSDHWRGGKRFPGFWQCRLPLCHNTAQHGSASYPCHRRGLHKGAKLYNLGCITP